MVGTWPAMRRLPPGYREFLAVRIQTLFRQIQAPQGITQALKQKILVHLTQRIVRRNRKTRRKKVFSGAYLVSLGEARRTPTSQIRKRRIQPTRAVAFGGFAMSLILLTCVARGFSICPFIPRLNAQQPAANSPNAISP